MKKIISLLLIAVSLMSFAFVGTSGVNAISGVKVKKIAVTNLTGNKFYVAKGKSVSLKTQVTVTPNKLQNKKLSYKSGNKSIAKVSSNGKVTGVKTGSTKITVTSKADKTKKLTVKVKITKPIKKITLNKSSVTLSVKKTVNLKPSLTPGKNVCSTVKYTTSNKNVATVSSKGIVTAKKAGTAKITASAIDGTNKKAVCTVKVEDDYSIVSVRKTDRAGCDNTKRISITLNKAKEISVKDITVKRKLSAGTKYNEAILPKSLITNDNKNYIVYLDSYIYCGDYLSVTISSLNGVKTKNILISSESYTEDEVYYVSKTVGNGFYSDLKSKGSIGCVSARVVSGSLPKGISVVIQNDKYYLEGTFFETCSNQKCTIEITDEYNHKRMVNYQFTVGDDTHIWGNDMVLGTESKPIYDRSSTEYTKTLIFTGGSGSYKLSLENDYDGLFLLGKTQSNDGAVTFLIDNSEKNSHDIKSKYNVVVNITDSNNSSLTGKVNITCNFTKTNAVTVQHNKFLDSKDYCIVAVEKSTKDEFLSSQDIKEDIRTDTLHIPCGTYDFYYKGRVGLNRCILSNYEVTKDEPLKVTMPKTNNIRFLFRDENNQVIYVPHSYELSCNITNDDLIYFTNYSKSEIDFGGLLYGEKYTFDIKITNYYNLKEIVEIKKEIVVTKDADFVITVTNDSVGMPEPDLIVKNTGTYGMSIKTDYDKIVEFTPKETGEYTIYSTGKFDTRATCFDANCKSIASNDDGGENKNFKMVLNLTAGEKYYLKIHKLWDKGLECNINLVIEK